MRLDAVGAVMIQQKREEEMKVLPEISVFSPGQGGFHLT